VDDMIADAVIALIMQVSYHITHIYTSIYTSIYRESSVFHGAFYFRVLTTQSTPVNATTALFSALSVFLHSDSVNYFFFSAYFPM
jgi:hypothetical protein